jgi:opacity protein-like surface antigen
VGGRPDKSWILRPPTLKDILCRPGPNEEPRKGLAYCAGPRRLLARVTRRANALVRRPWTGRELRRLAAHLTPQFWVTLRGRWLHGDLSLVQAHGWFALFTLAAASPAVAADLPSAAPSDLGAYTIAPQAATVDPWHGFYVGSGVTASFAKGAKSAWGGDAFAGYDHRFDSGLVLGAEFSTGYMPWASSNPQFKGFDYAGGEVKVGYEMGMVTPYLMTGVALTKGSAFVGATDPGTSFNALFSGPGSYQALGYVGGGVDYKVNDKVTIGVSGFVGNGAAAIGH